MEDVNLDSTERKGMKKMLSKDSTERTGMEDVIPDSIERTDMEVVIPDRKNVE